MDRKCKFKYEIEQRVTKIHCAIECKRDGGPNAHTRFPRAAVLQLNIEMDNSAIRPLLIASG